MGSASQRATESLDYRDESELRIRSIFETALDAVVTMDPVGLISSWNAEAERLFGWSQEEEVGSRMSDTIIPPQHREAHGGAFNGSWTLVKDCS